MHCLHPAMSLAPTTVYRCLLVYRQKCRIIISESSHCVVDFALPNEESNRGGSVGRLVERPLYWCTHGYWLSGSGETAYRKSIHGKVRKSSLDAHVFP